MVSKEIWRKNQIQINKQIISDKACYENIVFINYTGFLPVLVAYKSLYSFPPYSTGKYYTLLFQNLLHYLIFLIQYSCFIFIWNNWVEFHTSVIIFCMSFKWSSGTTDARHFLSSLRVNRKRRQTNNPRFLNTSAEHLNILKKHDYVPEPYNSRIPISVYQKKEIHHFNLRKDLNWSIVFIIPRPFVLFFFLKISENFFVQFP